MSHTTVSKTCTNQYRYNRCSLQLSELTSQDLNRTSTFSEVLDRKCFGYMYDCPIIRNLPKSSSFEDNAIILELQDFRLALSKNWIWIPKLLVLKSDYHSLHRVKLDIHAHANISDALFTYMFGFFWTIVRVNPAHSHQRRAALLTQIVTLNTILHVPSYTIWNRKLTNWPTQTLQPTNKLCKLTCPLELIHTQIPVSPQYPLVSSLLVRRVQRCWCLLIIQLHVCQRDFTLLLVVEVIVYPIL